MQTPIAVSETLGQKQQKRNSGGRLVDIQRGSDESTATSKG